MKYPPAPRRRACIAYIGRNKTVQATLKTALTDHAMDIISDNVHTADRTQAAPLPDAAIVDLRPEAIAPQTLEQAIHATRQTPRAYPVLFLVTPEDLGTLPIIKLAETDTVIPFTTPARPLVTGLRQLLHSTAKAKEVSLRIQTLSDLGLGAFEANDVHELADRALCDTTLFLAEPGPEVLSAMGNIAPYKTISAALSRAQALHALEMGRADGIIMLVQKNRKSLSGLVRLLRRHTDLSSLPIIILEQNPAERHAAYWASVGADVVLPAQDGMMAAALCRRGARTRIAGQSLDHLLSQSVVTDFGEVSRLASTRYFEACLAHRCHKANSPFALGVLRLLPEGTAPSKTVTAALSEAGVYLAMATKGIDMVARPAPDLFLVSLPGADRANADASMATYTQLVQDLKFGGADEPVTFKANSHTVTGGLDDTPAALVTQLLKGLPQIRASSPQRLDA
ncbi:MAG: hypothetical protein AAF986_09555 [Pseudomonadota bacterium]